MLRQTAFMLNDPLAPSFDPPLYVPRYGFVARNQAREPETLNPPDARSSLLYACMARHQAL